MFVNSFTSDVAFSRCFVSWGAAWKTAHKKKARREGANAFFFFRALCLALRPKLNERLNEATSAKNHDFTNLAPRDLSTFGKGEKPGIKVMILLFLEYYEVSWHGCSHENRRVVLKNSQELTRSTFNYLFQFP